MISYRWIRLAAALQFVNGGIGAGYATGIVLSVDHLPSSAKAILILSCLSIWMGVMLWRKSPRGLELSIVLQFLQVTSFARPLVYDMTSGASLYLVRAEESWEIVFKVGAVLGGDVKGDDTAYLFAVNLVAATLLLFLSTYWWKCKGHDRELAYRDCA